MNVSTSSLSTPNALGTFGPDAPPVNARLPSAVGTRVILVFADLLALASASAAATVFWSAAQPLADPAAFVRLWPLLLAIPVGFALAGLYPAAGLSPVEENRRTTLAVSAVFGLVIAALFFAREVQSASRGIFVIAWLLSVFAVPLMRSTVRSLFGRRAWWGLPAVVLGAGRTGRAVVMQLGQGATRDLTVVGCLDDDLEKNATAVGGVPVLGRLSDAPEVQKVWNVSFGIVAMPGLPPERLARVVREHAHVFPHLVVIPNVFGLSSIGVGTREIGSFVGLYNKQNLLHAPNMVFKRVLDLVLLVPIAIIAVPLLVLAALAVELVSPGNPFYTQRREGRNGRPILVWKLRTMRNHADEYLERYLDGHPDARTEWERHFKLTDDPRVLPVVGKFLRRSSIDELPQLLNILLGQMSFVGPRPFPYYHLAQFEEGFRRMRTKAVPGLTGYWQVMSRSSGDLVAQQELDTYYIANWSLWMDIYLLFKTPLAVLFGKGAY